ncbi:MAG: GIY-YIG nuclease family protein [Mariprofundus sp.]|nr:GIY-YIG nuclease family protein [Mariprofundus sp.]
MADKSDSNKHIEWYIYLIRCNNGHLYTGISTDVARRFSAHQCGKGAKYLRGKNPLELVYQKKAGSRSDALKSEALVKKMTKAAKENMIRQSH